MCTCLQWLTKEGRIILDGQQWQAGELVSYLLLVSVTLFQFLQLITQKYKNIEGCREWQNEETCGDLTCYLSLFGCCTHVACRFLSSFCRGRRLFLSELLVSQTLLFSMFWMYRINYKQYQTISQWKPTDILKQNLMIKVYNWWIKWTWFADMYMVWKMKMCRSTCKFVRFTFKILKVSQIIVKKEVHKECVNY